MIAKGKRKISSGKEFDHLFPQSLGTVSVMRDENASLDETIDLIKKIARESGNEVRKLVNHLKSISKNDEDFLKKLWNFIYKHIDYKLDEKFIEQVRSPKRLWHDRKGDCDCYSTFISTCLIYANIPHKLRITKYFKPDFQHIYIVVPKNGDLKKDLDMYRNRDEYIVLDCVTDSYNHEVNYSEKRDYEMKLERLDGFGNLGDMPSLPQEVSAELLSTLTALNQNKAELKGLGQLGNLVETKELYVLDNGVILMKDQNGNFYEKVTTQNLDGLGKFSFKSPVKSIQSTVKSVVPTSLKPADVFKSTVKSATLPFTVAKTAVSQIKQAVPPPSAVFKKVENFGNGTVVGRMVKSATRMAVIPFTAPANIVQKLAKGESLKSAVNDSGQMFKRDAGAIVGETLGLKYAWRGAMEANMFNVAKKVKFGYLSPEEAFSKFGISRSDWDKIKKQLEFVKASNRNLGGKDEEIKKSILMGKGNDDGELLIPGYIKGALNHGAVSGLSGVNKSKRK